MENTDILVQDLQLTYATHIALRNARLGTVQDVIDFANNKGLMHMRNLGRKHREELIQTLDNLGIDILKENAVTSAKTVVIDESSGK